MTPRQRRLIAVSTAAVGAACVLAVLWMLASSSDPAAAPEFSLPPALIGAQDLKGRRSSFDGRTTEGWHVEGPHEVREGTLELGGAEPARAIGPGSLEEGDVLEFDFFEAGPAGATLRLKPTLIAPQPPDPEFIRDILFDLSLDGFVYRRWHTVRVRVGHKGTSAEVVIDISAHHGGPGREGEASHSFPARGGCRFDITFEVPRSSRLYLRNVLVGRTGPRE